MIKFVLTAALVLSLLLLQTVYSQKKSDLEQLQIQGKVKNIEYFYLSFDPSNGWSSRKPWISEFYNTNSNIIERTVFRDGQISSQVISFYDARGRNTGNNSFSSASDIAQKIASREELILDAAGNTVQLNVYSRGGSQIDLTHTYNYDARGNQTERNYGAAVGKSVMTYDENNNETSMLNSNGAGVVYNKNFTEYNEQNRKIKWSIYRDEILRYQIQYKYDAKGRLSEVETRELNIVPNMRSSHAPEAGRIVYGYDDKRKTIWTTKHSLNGTPVQNSTTIFNERGEKIGLSCENSESHTCKTVFEYQLDTLGNWTRKTCYGRAFSGDVLSSAWAEERVISYY